MSFISDRITNIANILPNTECGSANQTSIQGCNTNQCISFICFIYTNRKSCAVNTTIYPASRVAIYLPTWLFTQMAGYLLCPPSGFSRMWLFTLPPELLFIYVAIYLRDYLPKAIFNNSQDYFPFRRPCYTMHANST